MMTCMQAGDPLVVHDLTLYAAACMKAFAYTKVRIGWMFTCFLSFFIVVLLLYDVAAVMCAIHVVCNRDITLLHPLCVAMLLLPTVIIHQHCVATML